MRRYPLIAALCAAMAACSSPEGDIGEPSDAPAALPPGREAIYEAARVGPEEFVRAVYAAHAAGAMGERPKPGQEPIYGRMLNAMVGEDVRRAGGEVPTLNWDPICDCQDGEGFRLESVIVREVSPTEAEADVVFVNSGETHRQTLKLVKEGPMWRISDFLVPGRPPLTETLMAAIS